MSITIRKMPHSLVYRQLDKGIFSFEVSSPQMNLSSCVKLTKILASLPSKGLPTARQIQLQPVSAAGPPALQVCPASKRQSWPLRSSSRSGLNVARMVALRSFLELRADWCVIILARVNSHLSILPVCGTNFSQVKSLKDVNFKFCSIQRNLLTAVVQPELMLPRVSTLRATSGPSCWWSASVTWS